MKKHSPCRIRVPFTNYAPTNFCSSVSMPTDSSSGIVVKKKLCSETATTLRRFCDKAADEFNLGKVSGSPEYCKRYTTDDGPLVGTRCPSLRNFVLRDTQDTSKIEVVVEGEASKPGLSDEDRIKLLYAINNP